MGGAASSAHATIVVSNFDPTTVPDPGSFSNGNEIGEAVMTGDVLLSLTSVSLPQLSFQDGETVAVYCRNSDGTIGALLFSNFSVSYNYGANVLTATATQSFLLQPDTGYFFSLLSNSADNYVSWIGASYSPAGSYPYTSDAGATLPPTNTDYIRGSGYTAYYDLQPYGPQLIEVEAVPEPSTWALLGVSALGVVVARRWHASQRFVA